MAQTTGAVNSNNTKVEISTDGTNWVDISGFASTVKPSGGERKTGEAYTFEGEFPISLPGKKQKTMIAVTAVYTEGASDVFEIVRGAYDSQADLYLRWSPKGGHVGDFMFTGSAGRITACPYPAMDASSDDPITIEFEMTLGGIVKSVIAE